MAFLAKVEELAPLIEASADESERSRRLAMPVVEAMSRAGSSRLWVPRSLGGAEADISTVVQVVEAVSRIDGAAGWCLTIAGNTSLPAGYLPSRAARDIFASDPLLVTAGSWAPFGQAVAVEGGYREKTARELPAVDLQARLIAVDNPAAALYPSGMLTAARERPSSSFVMQNP